MKEFKVNNHIKLKLEKSQTNIYINEKLFIQCKFLLLNIPLDKISSFDEIDSIDEATERLDKNLEGDKEVIPAEVEFWGHCSNMQVWAESNYDTLILHRNIAFPLLQELIEVGDPQAKRVFKEEVIKRIESGNSTVISYLIEEDYLNCFNREEMEQIFCIIKNHIMKFFETDNIEQLSKITDWIDWLECNRGKVCP